MAKLPQEMKRYPYRKNDLLQAWDSADELLIQKSLELEPSGKRILIINDQFGALSCALDEYDCTTYVDSYVSYKGIEQNSEGKITPLNDLGKLEGKYDFVLIQLPKNMSFFEDILCHLTQHLNQGSKVICGAMVKHIAPSSFELLQKYIGPTSTSLAWKKARLIFSDFSKAAVESPYPLKVEIEPFSEPFVHYSNLFSREKLDIGTRFFLEYIPRGSFENILDLGCANGIIGIRASQLNPQATIHFSDESAMAIKSAEINFKNMTNANGRFYWTNCFEEGPKNFLDLVLCNPPFHQNNTIGDFIAWQMFNDAFQSLKKGGVLRIIGNSHLGYQIKLKKIFGNSKIIATNQKFVICESVKI